MSAIMSRELRTERLNIRCRPDQLARIAREANAHGLSRTDFLLSAALGELQTNDTPQRLQALERRLDRVERLIDLTT